MKKFLVTANVDSEKFGKGQLSAYLTEDQIVEYANLNDADKLGYLKDNKAEFKVDASELTDKDVKDFSIQKNPTNTTPQFTRKMRMNINGKDTGWLDVNEDNEAQYNQMMEQFNDMQRQFNDRFRNFFSHHPGNLLDFGFPTLDDQEDTKELKDSSDSNDTSKDE